MSLSSTGEEQSGGSVAPTRTKLLTRGVVPYGQVPICHFPTRSAWLGRGPKNASQNRSPGVGHKLCISCALVFNFPGDMFTKIEFQLAQDWRPGRGGPNR
ncbi:Uncharacterized protein FKW44_021021 [Caligus rogercresseyi]|uniref:Uncharacterized protein n=1 Tax=Caligus rogercresseyi TaxID=217165 RepID=A0A7T8GR34_CALRO|nr:Uncharacterized protein FKW44_021021 [Caligus rogercresseyi]